MIDRICSQALVLACGLILNLPATAEEHKAPTEARKTPAAQSAEAKPVEAKAPPERKQAVTPTPVPTPAPQQARYQPTGPTVPQRIVVASAPARARVPPRITEAPKVMPAAAITLPIVEPAAHALHWSYEGKTGPFQWARMGPEFATCGSGTRQSPIDIRDGMKVDLDPVTFEYRPSSFKVVDNGHTIQANVNGWNAMRVMGRRFRLVQFHFHRPSEEMINGEQFEMAVHLVHQDGEGRLAVVAVLVEGGARQPVIQAVLNNLPLEKGEEIPASGNVDLMQVLPASRRYFTYMGSLTTPPCTEDVLWIVMKQPVQATADQLNLFSRMYPMNARPIQATSGRIIKESN